MARYLTARRLEAVDLYSAIAAGIFISVGLIGCDRNALQQAFSVDPKARNLSTPPSPTVTASSIPEASSFPSPTVASKPTASAALQPYMTDVLQLSEADAPDLFKAFSPNEPVTRAAFARWLVSVNNRLYRDRPSRQIRTAEASAPAFQDVLAGSPNFAYIQGLAEAGYIPSALSGDKNQMRFRPSDALTRETLLLWKVPVDRRQILPTVSTDRVKQLWGFKDAGRIAASALPAVAADHQNGDLSNIRRLFGSTLLFQPQKPLTQAEAVAALWFIGVEGEGFSAQDLLRAGPQVSPTEPSPTSSPAATTSAIPSSTTPSSKP